MPAMRNPPRSQQQLADTFADQIDEICRFARRKLKADGFDDFLMTAGLVLFDWTKNDSRSRQRKTAESPPLSGEVTDD